MTDPDHPIRRWVSVTAALLVACATSTSAQQAETGRAAIDQEAGFGDFLERPGHVALLEVMAAARFEPLPFTTDGCSGGMSEGWRTLADLFPDWAQAHGGLPPWEECCVTHDRAYHDSGGARSADQSLAARRQADIALRQCVADTAEAEKEALARHYDVSEETVTFMFARISEAMHAAVRVGGGPCSGLPWRWGYGFDDCGFAARFRD